MAEILGPATILAFALPTGVDGDRIAKWQLRDGTSYQQVVQQTALALSDLNTEFTQRYGNWMSITEEMMMEYENGGSVTELREITDVDKVDVISGSTIGHMIDLKVYGGGVGGTKRYFRDARAAQVRSHVATLVRQAKWRFEKKLFNRFFTNTENAIGNSGYDVPFVRGSGGNVDFTPPPYHGEVFLSSHDHFIGLDSGSKGFDDVIEECIEHLAEHGHEAPFNMIVSKTDVDAGSYHALADFVELKSNVIINIDRGGSTSGNELYANGTPQLRGVIGHYQSRYGQVDLMATPRVPTGFAGAYKSYGQLDPRNPLAVRVHPAVGFGIRIVTETTNDNEYPIKQLNVEFEFGVSVGSDRTNGVVAKLVSGGAYGNPTIS
jgi:hypothetical protein